MNHKETRNLIAFVLHAWPSVPWRTDDRAALVTSWQLVLADVGLDEATAVLLDLSRNGATFPPPPGVIAKTVLDARDRAQGRKAPDADQAWAEIQRGIHTNGYVNGPPDWSHPAVAAVVDALTWRELCLSTNHDTLRAHFLRLYDTAMNRIVYDSRSVIRPAVDQPTRLGELSP